MGTLKATLHGLRNLRECCLSCFDNEDGSVSVVNAHAEVIAILPSAARATSESAVLAQWKIKARLMLASVQKEHMGDGRSPWQKKCDIWITCLRSRAFDQWRARKATRSRFFNDSVRVTWEDAVVRMGFQLKNKGERKLRHAANPWLRWAETCSKNHNRKERSRVGKKQSANGFSRRSELQMCFKWRSSVPCDV